MLALEFFTWWYGQGWRKVIHQTAKRFDAIGEAFSVSTLLRTLFAPWRRIISYAGRGLDAHIKAAIDNAVSRFIGFLIRVVALLAAMIIFVITVVLSCIVIVIWPLLPVLGVALIVRGVL